LAIFTIFIIKLQEFFIKANSIRLALSARSSTTEGRGDWGERGNPELALQTHPESGIIPTGNYHFLPSN
jgi:hypothetical protein